MTITDVLVTLAIVAILSSALWKIRRNRKKGSICMGCSSCPMAGQCESSH